MDVVAGTSQYGEDQTVPEVQGVEVERQPATEPDVVDTSTGTALAFSGGDITKGLAVGLALIALGAAVLQFRRLAPAIA